MEFIYSSINTPYSIVSTRCFWLQYALSQLTIIATLPLGQHNSVNPPNILGHDDITHAVETAFLNNLIINQLVVVLMRTQNAGEGTVQIKILIGLRFFQKLFLLVSQHLSGLIQEEEEDSC
jgi:hypothetical protein